MTRFFASEFFINHFPSTGPHHALRIVQHLLSTLLRSQLCNMLWSLLIIQLLFLTPPNSLELYFTKIKDEQNEIHYFVRAKWAIFTKIHFGAFQMIPRFARNFLSKSRKIGRWRFWTHQTILTIFSDFLMVKCFKIPISLRNHFLIIRARYAQNIFGLLFLQLSEFSEVLSCRDC